MEWRAAARHRGGSTAEIQYISCLFLANLPVELRNTVYESVPSDFFPRELRDLSLTLFREPPLLRSYRQSRAKARSLLPKYLKNAEAGVIGMRYDMPHRQVHGVVSCP